ncbi:MAG TPA: YdeI/OmpD-associated family protein [Tepidisphaeraceae bacterium]|nr:YdeI/OmpD-associated family protein [Tepidisphaeraceae bacterium]
MKGWTDARNAGLEFLLMLRQISDYMPKQTSKVDVYIAKSQPFSRPILIKIRSLFHKACPEVEEAIKWNVPFFQYKGNLGMMAAFKQHVRWGLWRSGQLKKPAGVNVSMGGDKFTRVSELPSDQVILDLIKQAMELNEKGIKSSPRPARRPVPKTPPILTAALRRNSKAAAGFKSLAPSHRREYIEWINEAKQEETRQRRVVQAIQWIAQGKSRNWKYEKR